MLTNDPTRTVNAVYIEAPIEQIWDCLSTPSGWNSYLSDIAASSESAGPFREGEEIELVIGELTNHALCAEVIEFRRISLEDHFKALFPDGSEWTYRLKTTFSLEPVEHMVKVTVEVEGFTDDEMLQWVREGTEVGWRQSLFNLKCMLELGIDVRNDIFGYPRLGIFNYTASPEQLKASNAEDTGGNYLKEVFPNGPAAASGLQPGDLLTHIGAEPVPTYYHLVKALSGHYGKKEPVELAYIRCGSRRTARVHLSYEDQFTGLIDPTSVSLEEVAEDRKRKARL
ncbi:PDZ domain-containing protein [Paenibacillus chitinolyticus]